MEDLYTDFHLKRLNQHCYPNEFLVRTMLGSYPKLELSHNYNNSKMLDWACGDGRNLILLNNLAENVELYGFEVDDKVCTAVKERLGHFGVEVDIRKGRNSSVPFPKNYFDYVIASSSIYYVDQGETFQTNLNELIRIMKSGSYVIMTLPKKDNFILEGAEKLENTHYKVTHDPYGLRNDTIFKVFETEEQILREFDRQFTNICIGSQNEDYYGVNITMWLVVMKKKQMLD